MPLMKETEEVRTKRNRIGSVPERAWGGGRGAGRRTTCRMQSAGQWPPAIVWGISSSGEIVVSCRFADNKLSSSWSSVSVLDQMSGCSIDTHRGTRTVGTRAIPCRPEESLAAGSPALTPKYDSACLSDSFQAGRIPFGDNTIRTVAKLKVRESFVSCLGVLSPAICFVPSRNITGTKPV